MKCWDAKVFAPAAATPVSDRKTKKTAKSGEKIDTFSGDEDIVFIMLSTM